MEFDKLEMFPNVVLASLIAGYLYISSAAANSSLGLYVP